METNLASPPVLQEWSARGCREIASVKDAVADSYVVPVTVGRTTVRMPEGLFDMSAMARKPRPVWEQD